MRIVAGEFRGRTIKMPPEKFTRPTTDRNKESIFNYLTNQIDFDDILACDIYAGSGSIGLEMLSRGAGQVHFVEKNFPVIKVLTQNIANLKAEEWTKIFKMDSVRFTKISGHQKYDLIFADPPFFKDEIHKVVPNILEREYLTEEGIFLIERSVQTEKKDIAAFGIDPFKKLGDSLIYQFRNK